MNKGKVFVQCMSHELDCILTGAITGQLLDEASGCG